MDIEILHLIEGARQSRGLAVIIDVFRAFTVECFVMNNGAESIIPTASKELAYSLKTQNNDFILMGERHGKILQGFDYGNSPAQLENVNFSGKTIIHTTSAGTQGLDNAVNADEVITGSLVNAKAAAEYIKKKQPQKVSLVCMGLEALSESEEDTLCAEYIKSLLEGKSMDVQKEIESLKNTSGAKFFNKDLQDVFPEKDFYLSTQINRFDFVLRLRKENGLNRIVKIPL
ncbi:MAG: 2-phosphosulfolactate phosphatase [Leptospirales bacterium]|nr:2-phosphosulfolactate phosphatase [Leptospirales bacterium]